MRLKKFFAPSKDSNGESQAEQSDLDFNSEPKISGPVTRAMKKLMQQKDAAELAISILCDLTKNIVPCASGSKNAQTILCCLTLFSLDATLMKEKIGSSTNN